jgi:hypothetical protein
MLTIFLSPLFEVVPSRCEEPKKDSKDRNTLGSRWVPPFLPSQITKDVFCRENEQAREESEAENGQVGSEHFARDANSTTSMINALHKTGNSVINPLIYRPF